MTADASKHQDRSGPEPGAASSATGRGTNDPEAGADVGEGVIDLASHIEPSLAHARTTHSGRSSILLVRGDAQRVVLMTLHKGHSLGDHVSPRAATLHVLTGEVRLRTDAEEWLLGPGQLVAIPPDRHSVDAVTDAAFLLTVAL